MTKHFGFFCLYMLSFFATGCSIGSEFKEYKHLENASFPHVNSVPTFCKKSQEKTSHLIQKDYDLEKKELENLRDFLKSDKEDQ